MFRFTVIIYTADISAATHCTLTYLESQRSLYPSSTPMCTSQGNPQRCVTCSLVNVWAYAIQYRTEVYSSLWSEYSSYAQRCLWTFTSNWWMRVKVAGGLIKEWYAPPCARYNRGSCCSNSLTFSRISLRHTLQPSAMLEMYLPQRINECGRDDFMVSDILLREVFDEYSTCQSHGDLVILHGNTIHGTQ